MADLTYDDFIVPWGRATGALLRTDRPGQTCPLLSERITPLTDAELRELVGKNSSRPFVKDILDQDGVGSCAAEAVTGALMIARAIAGQEHVLLNPWSLYNTTSGGRDSGSNIGDNLSLARSQGIAPMSVWPRSRGWRTRLSAEAVEAAKAFRIDEYYDVLSAREMMTALALGFPVVYGASGHAVCKIEHTTMDYGIDLNSWGKGWKDGGFGVWASYRSINWGYGAYAVRTPSWTPAIGGVWKKD